MAVPKHLEEAVSRLEKAAARVELVREKPASLENHRQWLEALTEFVFALSEIHEYTNESIHEKLHELTARVGLRAPSGPPAPVVG